MVEKNISRNAGEPVNEKGVGAAEGDSETGESEREKEKDKLRVCET